MAPTSTPYKGITKLPSDGMDYLYRWCPGGYESSYPVSAWGRIANIVGFPANVNPEKSDLESQLHDANEDQGTSYLPHT